MSQIQIRALSNGDASRWDAFVEGHPEATFFHLSGWRRILGDVLGHRTHYLYAERDGELAGVLPLAQVKSLLFGNALVSTPFCVYGGIVAVDDEARRALEDAACALAERLGVGHLEMRNLTRRREDWKHKDLYVTFRKPIAGDPDENLKAIPRKQRAMVRKGIQAGLGYEVDTGIDRFYQAYSESVRNLGTPVLPKRYYASLLEVFGDRADILTVTREGRLVASVLSFYFRDQVLPYYGGGTDEARAVKGNDYMYWALMSHAVERGARVFDYGRSKEGTGSYSFKKNWGFEPEPLGYEYYLVKSRDVPDVNPLNPKYQLFIKAWQRLPLGVAQRLGPMLARSLG